MSVWSFIRSVAPLGVSIAAYRHASKAFRLGHRPLVRVVAVAIPQLGVFGPGVFGHISPPGLQLNQVILKNIGRGPALAVVAFDPAHAAHHGDVPVVEAWVPATRRPVASDA